MKNFTRLKDLVAANMDKSKMALTYDYAFNADTLTLNFHHAKTQDISYALFVFRFASSNMNMIVAVVEAYLSEVTY